MGKKTGHGKLKRAKWATNYNAKKGLKHRRMAKRAALLSKSNDPPR